MAPGYLLQCPIVPETKKIRTLLPGFGFFMVIEKGRLRFWAELGQAPCRWPGSQSLQDCRYAEFRSPFGLWRVTFLCVAKEKSPIERQTPGKSSATRIPLAYCAGRTYRRTRHIFVPPTAAPSSLTALLTRSTRLGDLEGVPIPCPPVTGLAGWRSVGSYAALRMVGVPFFSIYLYNSIVKILFLELNSDENRTVTILLSARVKIVEAIIRNHFTFKKAFKN